jgi:hypothetical protein
MDAMLRAELGVESVAAAIEAKAVQMANNAEIPPLLGGDDLKEARAEAGHLGGRPKMAQLMAVDQDVTPMVGPRVNLHDDIIKVTPRQRQGTSSEYLVRRLKCDAADESAPNHAQAKDALAKLQSGTITSARAAGHRQSAIP